MDEPEPVEPVEEPEPMSLDEPEPVDPAPVLLGSLEPVLPDEPVDEPDEPVLPALMTSMLCAWSELPVPE